MVNCTNCPHFILFADQNPLLFLIVILSLLPPPLLSPNVTTMLQACAAGLGIALLPVRLADSEARLLRLARFVFPEPVTEFKIVHTLAAHVGSYVSYRAVYDCMHYVGFIAGSGENGYRTNVRSCIKRIRNKFRAIDPEFAEIQNYQSFGYRWGKE